MAEGFDALPEVVKVCPYRAFVASEVDHTSVGMGYCPSVFENLDMVASESSFTQVLDDLSVIASLA